MENEQDLKQFLDEVRAGERPDVCPVETIPLYMTASRGMVLPNPGVIVEDSSYYQQGQDYNQLQALGIAGMIGKMCSGFGIDTIFMDHANAMISRGMPLGGYVWADPTSTVARQVELVAQQVNKCGGAVKSIFVDAEQCWKSWPEWEKYIKKLIPWSEVPKFTPDEIYRYVSALLAAIKARFPGVLVGIYTGMWFINGYAPRLAELIKQYPAWLAQYLTQFAGPLTPERVQEMRETLKYMAPAGDKNWPRGIWQFTSSAKMNNQNIDLNFIPYGMFFEMGGHKPVTTTRARVWVYAGPGTNNKRVTALPYNRSVEVDREEDRFLHLRGGLGWISKRWTRNEV